MNWRLFAISLLAFFYSTALLSQTNLFDGQRRSSEYYIYKLSPEVLKKIHIDKVNFEESMLTDFVIKTKKEERRVDLPRGNYVQVRAEESNLLYREFVVDDLYAKIIPGEKFAVCLYDSLGKLITDAKLNLGKHRMSYDKRHSYYSTKNAHDGDIVKILHKGVYHYLSVEKNSSYKYRQSLWRGLKNSWLRTKYRIGNIFRKKDPRGTQRFMVFNKPIYKPNDQVKFKAYLEKGKWKPYRDSVKVRLMGGYGFAKDTVLTRLGPYRPGMYSYSFDLNAGLGLMLDKSYQIVLESTRDKEILHQEVLHYEDYELKSITFSMKTDKTIYAKGDSIRLKLKAVNENDMPIYDGKVELTVLPMPQFSASMKSNRVNFVPDTLWNTSISLTEVAEKEVILPNTIFPADIGLSFQVIGTYLSSDNERYSEKLDLSLLETEKEIQLSTNDGIAEAKYFERGIEKIGTAKVQVFGESGEILRTENSKLPATIPLPWQASGITVETNGITKTIDLEDEQKRQLSYRFYRTADSVILNVHNPAAIPFWYQVRKAKRTIASGYTTQLNQAFAGKGNDGYSMQITYLFGGMSQVIKEELPFIQKKLNLDVNTATTVYPGQKAEVQLSVTDMRGKPVKDIDITAYGFTSKFKNTRFPNIPIGGLMRSARPIQNDDFDLDEEQIQHNKALKDWARWSKEMQLDTIAFYQFLFPANYYEATRPLTGNQSQLSPYIVVDGQVQGVHMLWIDGALIYSRQTQHQADYIFAIYPGQHDLRFRTKDREISVKGFYVEKGKRIVASFNAARDTVFSYSDKTLRQGQIITRMLPKEQIGNLGTAEINELKKQLISVTNNFGAWQLPNLNTQIELPAFIQTAGDLYYLNPESNTIYNNKLRTQVPLPVSVGPFPRTDIYNNIPKVAALIVDTTKIGRFEIEGGYQYTLYRDYQKLKSWDANYIRKDAYDFKPKLTFDEKIWTVGDIRKNVADKFSQLMQNSSGLAQFVTIKKDPKSKVFNLNLILGKDSDRKDIKPTLIFIEPAKEADRGYFRLYYGAERNFNNLPVNDIIVHIVKDDSISYSLPVKLKPHGKNYLKLDTISWSQTSDIAALAYKLVRDETIIQRVANPLRDSIQYEVTGVETGLKLDRAGFIAKRKDKQQTRVLVYQGDTPLIGATVKVQGSKQGYVTNFEGSVELNLTESNDATLEIVSVGYIASIVKVSTGKDYFVELRPSENNLEEVVVVGYGIQRKQAMTGSATTISSQHMANNISQSLQGRVAGVTIRGSNISGNARPLILVDGVPYTGDLSNLAPGTIASLNTIRDQTMVAMYGSSAANGVIMVQTKSGSGSVSPAPITMPYLESGNAMRVNFHDDAFWQPKLTTDAMGKASFDISYPDDITNWKTFFIAKGAKDFTDTKELQIKSFKAISAHLAIPRFAIRGDRFMAMGRIVNYLLDTLEVSRTINNGINTTVAKLKIGKSYRDPFAVQVAEGDSVRLSYSLGLSNGYFDGEKRSIPVFEKGLEQHQGDFKVLNDSNPYELKTFSALGEITVHAEANSLELVQREIEQIGTYKYLCNEQLASKLSALLSKKMLSTLLSKPFGEEKKILSLLKELQKNRNTSGGWGWWNKSETTPWISNYVVSVLLDAEDAGYKTVLDRSKYIEQEELNLKNSLASLEVLLDKDRLTVAKENLFSSLVFLNRLDPKANYKEYFYAIDKRLKSKTIKDKLLRALLISKLGITNEVGIADTVLQYASKTILGGMYWTNRQLADQKLGIFLRPNETNTENTLLAYRVLKTIGKQESVLEQIRNYFFAQRQQGSWSNIYESSRIIQTILPDLLKANSTTFQAPVAIVNGKRVTTFPYTQKFAPSDQVKVSKEGTGPLFVTAYQRFWNPNPTIETTKGFKISTRFKDNSGQGNLLKEGKPVKLEVSLELTGEAEYVQIEVPIPAGCSYESKLNGYSWKEAHREHFKDRVIIFCNKLSKGAHLFEIDLLPRYTGTYTLNPAKAELMYFPVFYGNEKLKEIEVN
ncbi:alpha-2-macroglobulin family protein [Sphingobacterium sp. GVS05A]|uniref:alpha-2-macroglobulin family protein n=1 Tax=Sphingobacterium sp. GVS05A TaxID=2862679 RepID=UPI001CBBD05E|nr:alpha-2-macroglobulin family protein [Sphingobacterium sp. GVS05A]